MKAGHSYVHTVMLACVIQLIWRRNINLGLHLIYYCYATPGTELYSKCCTFPSV